MTTTEVETCQSIAARYARGLEALDALQECWDDDPQTFAENVSDQPEEREDPYDRTPTRAEVVAELVDLIDGEAQYLGLGGAGWEEATERLDDIGGPLSAWLDQQLDLEVLGRLGADGWEVTGAAVLMGYGGPTVRYRADTDTVEAAWWGDAGSAHVNAPTLAAHVLELADELAAGWAHR